MRSYVSRLHLLGIATLLVVTVGLALFGWSLRPASGGYPAVGSNTTAAIASLPPGIVHPALTETLTRKGDGSIVVLKADPVNGLYYTGAESWSVDYYHLDPGYRLCTPDSIEFTSGGAASVLLLKPEHLSHPRIATANPDLVNPVAVDGTGPLWIDLCWGEGGPVQVNGAYLSARFFPVVHYPFGLSLTRQLNIGAGRTLDYSIQSVVLPSNDYGVGWQWSSQLDAGTVLGVSAVDSSQTQHDSYQAFLSGILFGVAGGALVALIQELVAPFRTRKELRPPEPGG